VLFVTRREWTVNCAWWDAWLSACRHEWNEERRVALRLRRVHELDKR
jgi:hypothetical protein